MNQLNGKFSLKYDALKLLDEETLNMLNEYASGSPEIVQDIIDSFEPEAVKLIEEIKNARKNEDVQLLKTATHSLAGISGSIGAVRLRQIATDAENAIKADNPDEAMALSELIIKTYDELIALLKTM